MTVFPSLVVIRIPPPEFDELEFPLSAELDDPVFPLPPVLALELVPLVDFPTTPPGTVGLPPTDWDVCTLPGSGSVICPVPCVPVVSVPNVPVTPVVPVVPVVPVLPVVPVVPVIPVVPVVPVVEFPVVFVTPVVFPVVPFAVEFKFVAFVPCGNPFVVGVAIVPVTPVVEFTLDGEIVGDVGNAADPGGVVGDRFCGTPGPDPVLFVPDPFPGVFDGTPGPLNDVPPPFALLGLLLFCIVPERPVVFPAAPFVPFVPMVPVPPIVPGVPLVPGAPEFTPLLMFDGVPPPFVAPEWLVPLVFADAPFALPPFAAAPPPEDPPPAEAPPAAPPPAAPPPPPPPPAPAPHAGNVAEIANVNTNAPMLVFMTRLLVLASRPSK